MQAQVNFVRNLTDTKSENDTRNKSRIPSLYWMTSTAAKNGQWHSNSQPTEKKKDYMLTNLLGIKNLKAPGPNK